MKFPESIQIIKPSRFKSILGRLLWNGFAFHLLLFVPASLLDLSEKKCLHHSSARLQVSSTLPFFAEVKTCMPRPRGLPQLRAGEKNDRHYIVSLFETTLSDQKSPFHGAKRRQG